MKRLMGIACVVVLGMALTGTRAEAAATAKGALGQILPDTKFVGVSLNDCVDFIRDISGVNIHVNWKALEEQGVTKDTQVNLRLRSVSLKRVLTLLLSESGAGDKLTYYLDEGVIEITSRAIADAQMFTKVYPVEDLLLEVPDFVGPDFNLDTNGSTNSSSGHGSGSSSGSGTSSSSSSASIFSSSSTGTDSENKAKSKTERANELIKVITDTVYPEIWKVNGGTAGIAFWNGSLIVTAPRSVHEAIGGPID